MLILLAMAFPGVSYAEVYQPKLLDGVQIDAVDTYLNPKGHQLGLGISLYPFNSYYLGISANLSYTQQLSQVFAWQIIDASYYTTFQNGLTAELAQNFNVNPTQIERVNYGIGTNFSYYYAYGKFIFLNSSIRYFRGSIFLGGGILGTTVQVSPVGTVGTAFEVFVTEVFSCKLSLRNTIAIPSITQFVTFGLDTGISF
jgi:hypothetical protein